MDMSDRKRQFQEKHIAFLVHKKWGKYENILVCYISYKKAFLALNWFKFKEAL